LRQKNADHFLVGVEHGFEFSGEDDGAGLF
jgi:hypothetical protein